MSDEADNVVLRHLREMRADMATKGDVKELRADMATKSDVKELRADVDDLRHDVTEGFVSVTKALSDIRLADRLTAIEKRLTDLEHRRGA